MKKQLLIPAHVDAAVLLAKRQLGIALPSAAFVQSVDPLLVSFVGGDHGPWEVERIDAIRGQGLPLVPRLAVLEAAEGAATQDFAWVLRGVTSNERYATQVEQQRLGASSPPLGRDASTLAALIPISKSAEWWALAQDERRAIFEDRSRHIATSLGYLPRIARRLHHGRDMGEAFDFLTWFEYSPDDAAAFEDLVNLLRATEEWTYVTREVDIRSRKLGRRGPRSSSPSPRLSDGPGSAASGSGSTASTR